MNAVVTGANGFAGRWLCRLLIDNGVTVDGWVRAEPNEPVDGVSYRMVDIRHRGLVDDAMSMSRPDTVYHLAAMTNLRECDENAGIAEQTNVDGTRNVFSAMPVEAKGLMASTCHVYGVPQELPISEGHPLAPIGVYAQTKRKAEIEALVLKKNIVIARSFHHTGPGQEERYALADWSGQVRRGAPAVNVGDLSVRRDYCDVRDIVAGYILLCLNGIPGETYNLCSGESFTLGEMFEWIRAGTDTVPVVDQSRMRANDVPDFRGNPAKAERLGWKRRWRLVQTLEEMSRNTT